MQPTPYDLAFIGVGGTVLGAIVGAMIAFCLALRLADINARRFAGLKLREAFAPEIAKFRQPLNWMLVVSILEAAFEKHNVAVNEFRF